MSIPEVIPHGPISVMAERRCLEVVDNMVCAARKGHEGPHVWRRDDEVMIELPVVGAAR